MVPERMTIPPNEAQFLESRKFQAVEICQWYGVPPHKLGVLDRSTWNNIEHQELEFVTDTVQPWVTQFEEEANLKLFGRVNRGVVYTKFNMAALLRGDIKTRFGAYEIGHRNGWLCANEIRAFEEMNPIPLGNMYVMQGQMMTRQQIKEGKQKDAGAPAAEPSDDDEPTDPNDRLMDSARMLNLARTSK
jgi:phage portal protein BeeE